MAGSERLSSPEEGYWYDGDDTAVSVLSSLRRFRAADHARRRREGTRMDINTTDMAALQHVIARERSGDPATPTSLAEHLEVSTASVAKMLGRLAASGHVLRMPHEQDRRSVMVLATDHAHEQIRLRLGTMHAQMLEAAQDIPEGSRGNVVDFLEAMTGILGLEDEPDPHRPPHAHDSDPV